LDLFGALFAKRLSLGHMRPYFWSTNLGICVSPILDSLPDTFFGLQSLYLDLLLPNLQPAQAASPYSSRTFL